MADEVVQSVRKESDLRRAGMDNDSIRSQQWAAMGKKHQEKTKAKRETQSEQQSTPKPATLAAEPGRTTVKPTQVAEAHFAEQVKKADLPIILSQPVVEAGYQASQLAEIEVLEQDNKDSSAEAAKYIAVLSKPVKLVAKDSTPRTQSNEAVATEPIELYEDSDTLTVVVDLEYQPFTTEAVVEPEAPEAPEAQEPTFGIENDVAAEVVVHEAQAELDQNTELLLELETVETYQQLRDLIAEAILRITGPVDTTTPADKIVRVPETERRLQPVELETFESFLASYPLQEDIPLRVTKEHSAANPLEQYLMQLVEFMADSIDEEQRVFLLASIDDLEKHLPNYSVAQESEESMLRVAPKLTDTLLLLLRELGYKNPKEALAEMVERFGVTVLLQTLTSLFLLANKDTSRELLGTSTLVPSTFANPRLRLGNLMLKLTMINGLTLKYGIH